MSKTYSSMIGVGSYLPQEILTNDDLAKRVDTSNEWILTRTGIRERHIVSQEETPASIAEQSAQKALQMAGIQTSDLGLIIVSTANPEKLFPSTACLLHHRLQAPTNCMSFDINVACTGFLYGLSIANQFICSGAVKYALVVGAEVMTSLVDWTDRNTCVLFGDGSGAVVLAQDSTPGLIDTRLYSDGRYAPLIERGTGIYGDKNTQLKMSGRELFKIAVEVMVESIQEIMEANHLTVDQIDWLIPHQANCRIIDFAVERLKFPRDKVLMTIDQYANTSSASIPLALDLAIRDGRIQKGQTLLLDAFGAGLAWGSVLLKY